MNVTFKPSNQNNQSKANKGQLSSNSGKNGNKPSNCNLKKNNCKSTRYSKITSNLADKFLKYNFNVLENEKNDFRESEPSENKIHYSKANNSNTNDSNEMNKEIDNRYKNSQENENNKVTVNDENILTIDTPKGNILKTNNNEKKAMNYNNYESKQYNPKFEKETILRSSINVPTPINNTNLKETNFLNNLNKNDNNQNINQNNVMKTGNFGFKLNMEQDNKSVATQNTNITSQTTKNNYYKKMILFTKDSYNNNKRDNKSCLSTRSKISNDTYTNRKSNPLLDSIFKNETMSERRKSTSLFKKLILNKLTYLDLNKEEFYSNEKKEHFHENLNEMVELGLITMSKEIKEKQDKLIELENKVSNLNSILQNSKSELENKKQTIKEMNVDEIKILNISQNLFSKEVLMTKEGRELKSLIEMNSDKYNRLKETNSLLNQTLIKEKVNLDETKKKNKYLKSLIENINNEKKELKTGIIIHSKKLCEYNLGLKKNTEKLKGVVTNMNHVNNKIIKS